MYVIHFTGELFIRDYVLLIMVLDTGVSHGFDEPAEGECSSSTWYTHRLTFLIINLSIILNNTDLPSSLTRTITIIS